MNNDFQYQEATIAAGSTTSNSVNVAFKSIFGMRFPVGFEGATVTLEAATGAGGDYLPVKDAATGNAVTIYAGSGTHMAILPSDLAGLANIKIISASAATEDRKIIIVLRNAA